MEEKGCGCWKGKWLGKDGGCRLNKERIVIVRSCQVEDIPKKSTGNQPNLPEILGGS